MVFSLAKAGWYSSNPSFIYNAPIDEVILAYQYETMARDYETTEIMMSMES